MQAISSPKKLWEYELGSLVWEFLNLLLESFIKKSYKSLVMKGTISGLPIIFLSLDGKQDTNFRS